MPYLVKLPDGWLCRGRTVATKRAATVYNSPSAATTAVRRHGLGEITLLDGTPYVRDPRGRTASLTNGRAITLYLDADTIAAAKKAGDGSASEGIRRRFADD